MWIRQLQLIQNTAARVLTKTSRVDHISPALRRLLWLPVCQRTNLKIHRSHYCITEGVGGGPEANCAFRIKIDLALCNKVKKENDSTDGHLHRFTVKFTCTDCKDYSINCDRPCTVLEAIKSTEHFKKMKNKTCLDGNILIQQGKQDKESIVATHFPCSCISDGESLIISCESEKVEEAQNQQNHKTIHSRDKYSVFYINTVGGKDTKTKKLFRNKAVKQFKYLCVYGEKGMTVEEALKRDGRFIDDLSDFTLSDNENPNCITERTQKIDNLDHKKFKLCLPRKNSRNYEKLQK